MYQMTKVMGMFVFFAKHTKADAQSFTCHGSELSQNPVPQQQGKSFFSLGYFRNFIFSNSPSNLEQTRICESASFKSCHKHGTTKLYVS